MKEYDCVVISAHPDDAFLGMGGTLQKLKDKKKNVLIVCATNGENGNECLKHIRKVEIEKSCKKLECDLILLEMKDGELSYNKYEMYQIFSKLFIIYNPTLLFTHHKSDVHSDHYSVYEVVCQAAEKLWHTHKENTHLKMLFQFSPISLSIENIVNLNFNYIIETSEIINDLVLLHQSQMPYIEKNLKKHEALNRYLGTLIGAATAEGFWAKRYDEKNIRKFDLDN